jgi:hypothetical protein
MTTIQQRRRGDLAVLNTIPGNDRLLEQMKIVKEDPSYAQREVYLSTLKKARFLVPIKWINTQNTRRRTLATIYKATGEKYLLAFTSWEELFKWSENEDERVVALSHEELRRQVLDKQTSYDGFVIDPYGVNLITPRQEILSSLPLVAPQTTRSAGREAVISLPRVYSQRLLGAITSQLKQFYNVRCAYFLLMATEDGEKNYLVVIDFVGDNRRLFYHVMNAAQPFLKKNEHLTIVSTDSALGRMATRGQKPFYTRSRFSDIRAWLAEQYHRLGSWYQSRKDKGATADKSERT